MMTGRMADRDISFDLLRVVAVIVILLHHLPQYHINVWQYLKVGAVFDFRFIASYSRYTGLGIFVFMSGYLLQGRNRELTDWADVYQFLTKRFLRIYPLYYLALSTYVLLFFFLRGSSYDPLNFLTHIFGLQLFFGAPLFTIWFVGLVSVYYVLFAIYVHFDKKRTRIAPFSLLIFIVLFAVTGLVSQIDNRLALYWLVFMFGAYASSRNMKPSTSVCLVLFALLLSSGLAYREYIQPEGPVELMGLGWTYLLAVIVLTVFMFTISLLALTVCRRVRLGLFRLPVLRGAFASYSVYLFHRPVYQVVTEVIARTNLEGYRVAIIILTTGLLFLFSFYLQKVADIVAMRFQITPVRTSL